MDEWYYENAGTKFGPVSEAALKTMLQQGGVTTGTRAHKGGSESWVYLGHAFPPEPAAKPMLPAPTPAVPPPTPSMPPAVHGPPATLWIFALLAMVMMIVLGFFRLVFSGYALLMLAGVSGMPVWFVTLTDVLDAMVGRANFGMLVLLIIWQGCAFGSIRRLYDPAMVTHGRGSGFWWITPVASLFMPFVCLREMRWLSRERRRAPKAVAPAGVLAWLIQIMLIINIVSTVAGTLTTAAMAKDETLSTLDTAVNLCVNAGGLLLMSLLIVFILRNLIQQVLLYRHWHAVPQAA